MIYHIRMGISDQCKAAMIEHGVLMNGDVPAGMEMINRDVIRVAIAQAGGHEDSPNSLKSLMGQSINLEDKSEFYTTPVDFPENIEELTREAFSFWFEGEIEFVGYDEGPDLRMFAFDTDGAFGSFPVNTDQPDIGASKAIIGIGLQSYPTDEKLVGVIRHESGHSSFGVDHGHDGIEDSKASYAKLVFKTEDFLAHYLAACEGVSEDDVRNKVGVMSYGPDGVGDYDVGAKEFVQTGILPNSNGGAKP